MKPFFVVIYSLAALLLLMGLIGHSANAEDQPNGPTIVELFTSQSCSSCPPADALLNDTTRNSNTITLGFHVTYWDHLRWKDTVSRPFSTTRQRGYSAHNNTDRVYTPQMIVNGEAEFNGANRKKLQNAIKNAKPTHAISLTRNNESIAISLPDVGEGAYTLWIYGVKDVFKQDIGSGENKGRTVTYTSAVLTEKNVGDWDGTQKVMSIDYPHNDDISSVVVLAQEDTYGPIIAAAELDL